jgi:hypothetical protein
VACVAYTSTTDSEIKIMKFMGDRMGIVFIV